MMVIECSVCGTQFDPDSKTHRPYGFYTECRDCGRATDDEMPTRHLGVPGGEGMNKAGNISIIRNPDAHQAQLVKDTNTCGYRANLRFTAYSQVGRKPRVGKLEAHDIENWPV